MKLSTAGYCLPEFRWTSGDVPQNPEGRILSVLCAILVELQSRKKHTECPVSVGTAHFAKLLGEDSPITREDYISLGIREINALRRSGAKWWSEVTPELFRTVPQCGKKTIERIMAYKNSRMASQNR
jgi:hypothetical protein